MKKKTLKKKTLSFKWKTASAHSGFWEISGPEVYSEVDSDLKSKSTLRFNRAD